MHRRTQKMLTMALSVLIVCSLPFSIVLSGDLNTENSIYLEAEHMELSNGYLPEENPDASGEMVIKTEKTSEFSTAVYTFTGVLISNS